MRTVFGQNLSRTLPLMRLVRIGGIVPNRLDGPLGNTILLMTVSNGKTMVDLVLDEVLVEFS